MTTIVSRIYDTADIAEAAAEALREAGHDPRTISVVTADGPDALRRICAAGVGSTSAAVYAGELERGRALLVVRAPFTPFGRAREAIRLADRFVPVEVPGATPNQHVRDYPDPANFNTILRDHPRWFSHDMPPQNPRRRGLVSAAFGIPTLSRRRPGGALRNGRPVTELLGLPMVLRRGPRRSVLSGGGFLSRFFWPMPLLSRRSG
jgi:hypothetical protein